MIQPSFDETMFFDNSTDLAAVKVGKRWGFIDKTGRMAIALIWANAFAFSQGLAAVERPH